MPDSKKLAATFPEKFWKSWLTKLTDELKKPLISIDDAYFEVLGIAQELSKFVDELQEQQMHQFANTAIKHKLKAISGRLIARAKQWERFQEALVSDDDDNVIRAEIVKEIVTSFYRKRTTVGSLLKEYCVLDPTDIDYLAKSITSKASAEDRAVLSNEGVEEFFEQPGVKSQVAKIVTVKEQSIDVVSWFKALKKALAAMGSDPDQTPTQFDLYGIKIVVQDEELAEKEVQQYMGYIRAAYHKLRAKGLHNVWHGEIYIDCEECGGENPHSAGGTGGHYEIGKDRIVLFERPDPFITELLIHELGHRYWFKGMTQSQRLRFKSLVKTKVAPDEGETPDVEPVSDYGKANIDEAFAEAFLHYVAGKDMSRNQLESFKSVMTPKLASIAQKLKKLSG